MCIHEHDIELEKREVVLKKLLRKKDCLEQRIEREKKLFLAAQNVVYREKQRKLLESFVWISDEAAAHLMVQKKIRSRKLAKKLVTNCREYAERYDYKDSIFIIVKAGFSVEHVPQLGPCWCDFYSYVSEWHLEHIRIRNGAPTKNSLVFFVPRIPNASFFDDSYGQMKKLEKLRQLYSLADHYFSSFGEIILLSGLVLAHFARTGERVPLVIREGGGSLLHKYDLNPHVRTDTYFHGSRLIMGGFKSVSAGGLKWTESNWQGLSLRCHTEEDLGCFGIGIDLLD